MAEMNTFCCHLYVSNCINNSHNCLIFTNGRCCFHFKLYFKLENCQFIKHHNPSVKCATLQTCIQIDGHYDKKTKV